MVSGPQNYFRTQTTEKQKCPWRGNTGVFSGLAWQMLMGYKKKKKNRLIYLGMYFRGFGAVSGILLTFGCFRFEDGGLFLAWCAWFYCMSMGLLLKGNIIANNMSSPVNLCLGSSVSNFFRLWTEKKSLIPWKGLPAQAKRCCTFY